MAEILLKKREHTALITFNNPSFMNALSSDYIRKINETLDQVEEDEEIYTLIFTGSGKAFIAGADIKEMYPQDESSIFKWSEQGSGLNLRIEKMKIPVIAAINGYALGGGLELALACDIRIASEHAKMGCPETGLGVICGAGGTQRLPRAVGAAMAKELLFTAEIIDAHRALKIGLVNKVVPQEVLLDEAFYMAAAIEKNGQIAVQAAKKAVSLAEKSDIGEGCLLERQIFSSLFNTEDQKIGMGSFLKKEKTVHFKNR